MYKEYFHSPDYLYIQVYCVIILTRIKPDNLALVVEPLAIKSYFID